MKFVAENNMISIKIQQGELGTNGSINTDTIEWMNVSYGYDVMLNKTYTAYELNRTRDFFAVDFSKNKVYLGDLKARPGHVMTGIAFREDPREDAPERSLRLDVRFTPFDFKTGKLNIDDEYWAMYSSSDKYTSKWWFFKCCYSK